MSSKVSNALYIVLSILEFALESVSFNSGNCDTEFFSEIKSLALAVPYEILPANLSISYTFFKEFITSSLRISFSFNSFTAPSLFCISFTSTKGSLIHLLKSLPPIDVDVLSSTHSRVPFFDLSLSFSVSSRFLRAFISKAIYLVASYIVILFKLSGLSF